MSVTRFLQSELPLTPARESLFHVIPAPFEASVSYGHGTALGPAAILEASCQLEVFTVEGTPSRRGIYTWPTVDCAGNAETVLARIETAVSTALVSGPQGLLPVAARNKSSKACRTAPCVPVLLGGEHTVTLGALRALKKRYGPFGVIQFDAHADLRDTYEDTPYSHACVMRRAVQDLKLPLFQIGVRSLSPEERDFRSRRGIPHLDARHIYAPGPDTHQTPTGAPLLPESFPDRVFLTFDIDALDASLMPATGTPEPGGLFWWDALRLIRQSLAGRILLGFDVVELAPLPHVHAPTYTAARLTHGIMAIADNSR